MKIKFFNLLILFSLTVFVYSCDRVGDGDVSDDQGGTTMQEMAGDWYVKFTVDGEDVYNLGYTLLSTYNTAANNGQEMWIDDHGNTWEYKVKTPGNSGSKTFGGSNLQNQAYDVKMSITDGKILKGAATTTGGNKSDSIVFKVEFADDPGTVYTVGGYKRTGFAEDEH